MNEPTPSPEPCPYIELPSGGFRVRLLDTIGDQIGEVDCDTEEDAMAISRVRPLLFQTGTFDHDEMRDTLAALERAGVNASNALYVRRLQARLDGGDA